MRDTRRRKRSPRFLRCTVCGRYTAASRMLSGRICSQSCGLHYSRCVNCGRFFLQGSSADLCSEECGQEYRLEKVRQAV